MARSSRPRAADFRAVYQLVGECRDLGDDQPTWRLHLVRGLGRMVGAESAQTGDGFVTPAGGADGGVFNYWTSDGDPDPAAFQAMTDGLRRSLTWNPMVGPYMAVQERDDGVARSRPELVADAEWYRSDYFEVQRAAGADATLFCHRWLPGKRYSNLCLGRPPGERDFTPRQKAVVREAHALLAPLVGGPLADCDDPSPSALPPRAKQVLRCLLEGDSDKQIAARLGVRPLTVNQHTKRVYAHFRVRGRAELLARLLGRGWNNKCVWADGG